MEGKLKYHCLVPFFHRFCSLSGMPTVEGLKRALQRVDAGPEGKNMVFWTSLREVYNAWIESELSNSLNGL